MRKQPPCMRRAIRVVEVGVFPVEGGSGFERFGRIPMPEASSLG
jgi:hypothetical protein